MSLRVHTIALAATLATAALAQGGLPQQFAAAIQVGRTAPPIRLLDTAGKQWDLAALNGQWKVVEFGACT